MEHSSERLDRTGEPPAPPLRAFSRLALLSNYETFASSNEDPPTSYRIIFCTRSLVLPELKQLSVSAHGRSALTILYLDHRT